MRLDLTDFETIDFNGHRVLRVDDLFLASTIACEEVQQLIKRFKVKQVMALVAEGEFGIPHERECKLNVGHTFDLDTWTFDELSQLAADLFDGEGNKLLVAKEESQLMTFMGLLLIEIFGHPKARAIDFIKKLGDEENHFNQQFKLKYS